MSAGAGAGPSLRYRDGEPNGLASMIGRLIEQNLERDPSRRRLLRPALVVLTATDADVRATLRIGHGEVTVANGALDRPHLEVAADSHRLLDLAAVPLWLGLPSPFRGRGREIAWALLAGRVRVRGLWRHPLRLSRLTRLLSAV